VSISEHELITRAKTGDTEAFCLLAKNYERRIYLLALHYCRHTQDAEDLSQEVWLKAYRSIEKFRGEASFYTWLRQITINSFLNHKRVMTFMTGDEKTIIKLEALDAVEQYAVSFSAAHALEAENGLHRKILVERVMHALGELTPQQRLIFLLKHREGMTYEEISKAFDCSTGAIKKALLRAVVKLRQHLGVSVGAANANGDYVAPLAASEKG